MVVVVVCAAITETTLALPLAALMLPMEVLAAVLAPRRPSCRPLIWLPDRVLLCLVLPLLVLTDTATPLLLLLLLVVLWPLVWCPHGEAFAVGAARSESAPKPIAEQPAMAPAATVRFIVDGLRGIAWLPIFLSSC